MERGHFGRLTTTEPTFSPVIWTTIATGRGPDAHGITGFEQRGPTGTRALFTSRDRRTKAFWNLLSESGLRVDVVGWWLTHPVEAISGVMVAQTNTAMRDDVSANRGIRKGTLIAGAAEQVHPSEREEEFFSIAREVESNLGRLQREVFAGAAESGDDQVESLFRASRWALRADAVYAEVGRRLAREDADLLAIYFGGADVVAHRFWRYYEPERFEHPPTSPEVEQLADVIPAYYRYVDHWIGSILEQAGEGVRGHAYPSKKQGLVSPCSSLWPSDENGVVAHKLFSDCGVLDLRKALQRKRRPTSSTPGAPRLLDIGARRSLILWPHV
jgi:predicted AlkP superfamily phosphohydrolase/phosphomutase